MAWDDAHQLISQPGWRRCAPDQCVPLVVDDLPRWMQALRGHDRAAYSLLINAWDYADTVDDVSLGKKIMDGHQLMTLFLWSATAQGRAHWEHIQLWADELDD